LPSPSVRPGTSPLYLIPSMQPAGPPAKPSVSFTPSVIQPAYAPSNPPTTVSTKDTNIVTPIHPAPASVQSISPSGIKEVSSEPSPSFTQGRTPMYIPRSMQPTQSTQPIVLFSSFRFSSSLAAHVTIPTEFIANDRIQERPRKCSFSWAFCRE
jgi:hypothetical protein